MKKILCLCLVLALLPICGMAEIVSLDEQVDQIFRDAKTVGGAFLVARNGEIVYERYYGEQQKTTHVPVTEKSYFRCASVTKLVTGIGLSREQAFIPGGKRSFQDRHFVHDCIF